MQEILAQLLEGKALSEAQAEAAIGSILRGESNESQVGALLALLARKGLTVEEIVGGARVMRAHVTRVPFDAGDDSIVIDTCGTGGTAKTFNVSTAAAIVTAAAGARAKRRLRVAKHGGRSRSGRGSAEVLAKLGVNIDASPETQAKCLREVGVCFSFAVNHHPAMKYAAGPRKSLGFPTIFNVLGPLCNPAGATRQLMGIYDAKLAPLVGEALRRLGAERAMVAHGRDGMDEISTVDKTLLVEVRDGAVSQREFDATSVGVAKAQTAALIAKDLDDAVRMAREVIEGTAGKAPMDITLVNSAAALVVGDAATDMVEGMKMAREAVKSGAAARTLAELARLSHGEL